MKISRESIIHNQSPEYRHALQELIKFELQALVERLSATGEEAIVLTASYQDGSTMQFGSQKAEDFLKQRSTLAQEFLRYCHEDVAASSGDELCNSGDEMEDNESKEEPVANTSGTKLQYSPITTRQRERTNSKRLSFTEKETTACVYDSVQNSDMSEKNDSASSVASFAEVEETSSISTNKKNLQCKICSRNCRSSKTLTQHMRLHMSQSYKCNYCGKIFTLKKSYQRHIKSHKIQEADRLFECGLCDKSFADLSLWKRHRMCHMDVRKYSCNLCGKAFFEKYSLKVHQTSHFYSSIRMDKNSDMDSKFSCHICGKSLHSQTAMRNHMLTHSAKKFTCEFCAKRFSQKYSYIRHRRIHTGEKPYKCGECEKSFSDGSAWSKHIKTHTGIKPYSCDVCSKSFYDKTLCKTHMKTHKGRRSYKPDEDNKRSFKMVSEEMGSVVSRSGVEKTYKSPSKLGYDTESNDGLYDNLHLHLNDKVESDEDSQLLDSGFATDLMPSAKDKAYIDDKSPDKKVNSIVESIVLDEKFQSDFVERNMPSKPIESDNELITSAFNEDFDILDDEVTEADILDDDNEDLQHSVLTDPIYKAKSDSHITESDKHTDAWQKKSRQKRSVRGKVFPESPAKCKICHKKFKQESLLKQHLQFHCMLKLYKCRYCGKQLSTKHSLIRHERIHVGDRPYQCYICQKTFADNYGCIRHINTHFNKDSKASNRISSKPYKPGGEMNYENESKFHDDPSKYHSPVQNYASVNDIHPFSSKPLTDSRVHSKKSMETASYLPVMKSDGIKQPASSHQLVSSESTKQDLKQSVGPCKAKTDIVPQDKRKDETKPVDQSLTKKPLYKCFKCAQLFVSEKLCIDHITQMCSKQELSASELVVAQSVTRKTDSDSVVNACSTSTAKPATANLFQCSLCLLMFEEKGACERHIADKCEKSKEDTDSAVKSILEEPFTQPEFESLPQLPFPEVSVGNSYLDITDNQVLLLSDSTLPSNLLGNTSSSLISDGDKTVAKSKLTNASGAPLSFIPFSQISSQTSSMVKRSPEISSTVQLSSDSQFTALLKKPIVAVGSSQFIISNSGINFVGQGTPDSVHKTSVPGKKKQGEKKSENDIEERTCTICNKVFTTKHILKQHTLIHMERKFECKYCMKKFHNKYGRDRHERIHTGEKPFSCPYCKKAFGDNSTYRKHTRNCQSGK